MTRLAALLSLVVVVGACGAASGSRASSSPNPSAADFGASSPEPTDPSAGPSCRPPADALTITLRGIHSSADIEVPVASVASVAPPGAADGLPDAGQFVGGATYRATFTYDVQDGAPVQVTPTSVRATLTTDGSTKPVPAKLGDGAAALTIPDGSGAATLTILATIDQAPCPTWTPSATFAVTLVPASTAAACPADQDSSVALLQKLDTRIRVGSSVQSFDSQAFQARYNAAGGSDSVPAFANFDPAARPVAFNASSSVELSAAGRDLTLTGADVQVWRRSDVVGPDDRLISSPGDPIDHETLTATGGSAYWQAPATPGQYVVGIFPTWSSDCLTGQGYLYVPVTSR